MEQRDDDFLNQFFLKNDGLLRERWRSSLHQLSQRLGQFSPDSRVFGEVRKLILNLVALVQSTGSAEQAVDLELKPIVSQLRALQTENDLSHAEMVLFLFFARDFLKDVLKDWMGSAPQGAKTDPPFLEGLNQVSKLLNRLGLVFFENSMRLKDEELSDQDVLAIEYALLYERTRQMAITDRLTGLYNFGYFLDRLKEERIRADRYHRLLSLILLDIDHFKKYNDTNGHPAGNEVLKRIAAILKEEAREVDIVARYGGEEMVIILPETSRRSAHELAERIRARIEQSLFPRMETQPLRRITVSAGVATFPVDAATEDDLIKKADKSLYQAKSKGRNQVVAFEPMIKIPIHYKPSREVSKVALVGSFNNWDKEADYMQRQADGSYQFIISLNPGVYHYKFVLNGVEWIPDPANPIREEDSLGGENSVLRVSGEATYYPAGA
ncbi:MAG TPA: diguanylate cyclase [bacterium]|nr:diguanylate cyclase [bacterium]